MPATPLSSVNIGSLYTCMYLLWQLILYELHLKVNTVPEFCLSEWLVLKIFCTKIRLYFWIYNEYSPTSAYVSVFLIVSFFRVGVTYRYISFLILQETKGIGMSNFPIPNTQPTKSTIFSFRYLYYITKLSIPTCFNQQGIIIKKKLLTYFLHGAEFSLRS